MIDAENSDIFDVLAYISFAIQPILGKLQVESVKNIGLRV